MNNYNSSLSLRFASKPDPNDRFYDREKQGLKDAEPAENTWKTKTLQMFARSILLCFPATAKNEDEKAAKKHKLPFFPCSQFTDKVMLLQSNS